MPKNKVVDFSELVLLSMKLNALTNCQHLKTFLL